MNFPDQVFYADSKQGETLFLEDQEAVHCGLVLRKQVGDIITVINGKGAQFKCGIQHISKRSIKCEILESAYFEQQEQLILAVAPTKNRDRLEWMVEKLVEIGLKELILLHTERTERSKLNLDRLEKKAIAAVKQSQRFYIPTITEMSFKEALSYQADRKYIAHCNDHLKREKSMDRSGGGALVMIGPEGDFTPMELKQAEDATFVGLDLGSHRLRTETAAIVTAARFNSV